MSIKTDTCGLLKRSESVGRICSPMCLLNWRVLGFRADALLVFILVILCCAQGNQTGKILPFAQMRFLLASHVGGIIKPGIRNS